MTYVVTQSCIKCKYTDCVDVCPVDCFVEGPNFLAIDPEECIDCTLCVAECPVEAIYADDDVPEDQQEFIEINERLSKVWPIITSRKDPLPEAEEFSTKTDKRPLLIESAGVKIMFNKKNYFSIVFMLLISCGGAKFVQEVSWFRRCKFSHKR